MLAICPREDRRRYRGVRAGGNYAGGKDGKVINEYNSVDYPELYAAAKENRGMRQVPSNRQTIMSI